MGPSRRPAARPRLAVQPHLGEPGWRGDVPLAGGVAASGPENTGAAGAPPPRLSPPEWSFGRAGAIHGRL
eukprot:6215721-Pyramimonas_sp.AAC.1